MLQSRITLMDEIKTFLCGHILLLVQVLRKHIFILYHYFQFLLGSWEGGRGGGVESVGKANNISSWSLCFYRSALKILGCFCFSVSGKGEMFFAVITNTLLAD